MGDWLFPDPKPNQSDTPAMPVMPLIINKPPKKSRNCNSKHSQPNLRDIEVVPMAEPTSSGTQIEDPYSSDFLLKLMEEQDKDKPEENMASNHSRILEEKLNDLKTYLSLRKFN